MSTEITNYATILIELVKAVKMHNFYPQGHPQLESIFDKSYTLLRNGIDAAGDIKWRVDQRGFYFDKLPLAPGSADIAALAKKLFFRRVKELTFTQRLTINDIKIFTAAVTAEPEDIQARGGIEVFFASLDVAGILLNEQRYEDLKKLKDELEEKRKEEEKAAEQEAAKQQAGEAEKSKEEEEQKSKEAAQDNTLKDLLEKIQRETDDLRYSDLSIRIGEKGSQLLAEGKAEEVVPAAFLFYKHTLPQSGRSEGIRKTAFERLKLLLTREALKHLAERAGAKEEAHRETVCKMLVVAGDEGASVLIDAIIEAPEAVTRRYLFNALVLFGPPLRPLAEAKLDHPQWFVVRQMAALLGEIGGPEALPALEKAYANPEPRVKKEVLKSMVKIRTPRVTAFLLNVLKENDQSLIANAIISLGIIKDPAAIEPLAEIAARREAFSEPSEASKEAVKALGVIGDPRAVPHLEKILLRKVWFGKKSNDEIRSLAAYSLGMIATPEALKAIEAVYAGSTGDLRMACKRVLEGREKAT